jgi:hypothetical protein
VAKTGRIFAAGLLLTGKTIGSSIPAVKNSGFDKKIINAKE